MEIALLGGTGDIGEGLALRWAKDTDHSIIIGSRKAEKAEDRAADYNELLGEHGHDVDVSGYGNVEAAAAADIVVVSVPPEYAPGTVETVADSLEDGDILVSPAVQMDRGAGGFDYDRPEAGSVAQEVAAVAPDNIPVVGAFQNLAAGALSNLDNDLEADVVVTGDDGEARDTVADLGEEIDGIRALDGGALSNTAVVESVTPLLINVAMNNDGMHDLGVRFQ
jgi:NADPH-dependent F420 reductase